MGLFGRKKRTRTRGGAVVADRSADAHDRKHLEQFIESRTGVEGFVEPPTAVSQTTLLLVAKDGEWTRRRVPSAGWAHEFANKHQVPTYDAGVVGYPQRMREYNRRVAAERKRRDREAGA
ncbi:hypothetical protein CLV56_0293 [Mumia flava]|uniref:Uncharacterized protein n=1 Tax=Mumia flava TaxID=1348852 RepID=A0A0B2AYL2_9ACTN|nr:hypothetical protein [Mumia flava]PJJ56089.1 hypothetical protein CLV56_0293 [Mumia flava]